MQTFLLYIILVLVSTFFNENSRDKKNKIKINRLRGSLIIDYEKLKNLLEILEKNYFNTQFLNKTS